MEKETLIEIDGLAIGYDGKPLYTGICLEIRTGDCIMLCGANGSGKTTLLKAIRSMDRSIVMIPSRIPKVQGFTLKQFIQLICRGKHRATTTQAGTDNILKSMETLGIAHLSDRDISTLSDGEFQKGCLAACLADWSRIILLDEPTASLDAESRRTTLRTLREICDNGEAAVIFSTHDLHEALAVANKVIALGSDGIARCSENDLEATVSTIFSRH